MNEAVQNEAELEAVQESPTEEVEQPVIEDEGHDQPEPKKTENSQEKNWKALREENENLKKMLEAKSTQESKDKPIVDEPSPLQTVKNSPVVSFYLAPEVQNQMQFEEFKAEQTFPELESNPLFAETVAGRYRRELDVYVNALAAGQQPKAVPSAFKIAKALKADWDLHLGSVAKKSEEEGAKKAKLSVQEREATIDAESRSGRGFKAQEAEEINKLRIKSREGNLDAIVARLNKL